MSAIIGDVVVLYVVCCVAGNMALAVRRWALTGSITKARKHG